MGVLGLLACGAPPAQPEVVQPEAVQPKTETKEAPVTKVETKAETKADTKEAPAVEGIEAVIRVDEKPGGKKFQGVWLELANGERWVVAYRPEEWLRGFEGRTVRVTGVTYQPFGQAINATHYRIATLEVSGRQGGMGPWFAVGPELTLTGTFARTTGAPGTKAEGSTWWMFVTSDGAEFEVEGSAVEKLEEGVAVQVVGRKVEPDMSYRARRGGDALWVLKVEKP